MWIVVAVVIAGAEPATDRTSTSTRDPIVVAGARADAEFVPLGVLHHDPGIAVLGHCLLKHPPTAECLDARTCLAQVPNGEVQVHAVLRHLRFRYALEPQNRTPRDGHEVDVVGSIADR
jgi:hypothetical protein